MGIEQLTAEQDGLQEMDEEEEAQDMEKLGCKKISHSMSMH